MMNHLESFHDQNELGITKLVLFDENIFHESFDISNSLQQLRNQNCIVTIIENKLNDTKLLSQQNLSNLYFLKKPVKPRKLYKWLQEVSGEERSKEDSEGGSTSRKRSRSPVTTDNRSIKTAKQYSLSALIAEDNVVNQLLLKKILSKYGCSVDVVDDGMKACAAAETGQYDIVLMDVNMPKMNGLDATIEIKKHLKKDQYPMIVAVTANALEENKRACLEAGMDDFVCKPFVISDVERILEKCAIRKDFCR